MSPPSCWLVGFVRSLLGAKWLIADGLMDKQPRAVLPVRRPGSPPVKQRQAPYRHLQAPWAQAPQRPAPRLQRERLCRPIVGLTASSSKQPIRHSAVSSTCPLSRASSSTNARCPLRAPTCDSRLHNPESAFFTLSYPAGRTIIERMAL